eukprot:403335696
MDEYQKEQEAHLKTLKFETRCVQSGFVKDDRNGSVCVPIDLSTLWNKKDTRLPNSGINYLYSRLGHPTRNALEHQLESIMQVKEVLTTNSIQSAYFTLSLLLNPQKDEIIVLGHREKQINMIKKIFQVQNLTNILHIVDSADQVISHINNNTKIIVAEAPENHNYEDLYQQIKEKQSNDNQIIFGLDVSTRYSRFRDDADNKFQKFDFLVADLQYFMGMDELKMGAFAFNQETLYEKLKLIVNGSGCVCQPMPGYLVSRGLKTLALRIDQQLESSQQLFDKFNSEQFKMIREDQILVIDGIGKSVVDQVQFDTIKKELTNSNYTHIEAEDQRILIHIGIEDVEELEQDFQKLVDAVIAHMNK